jgi:hypothetical protein
MNIQRYRRAVIRNKVKDFSDAVISNPWLSLPEDWKLVNHPNKLTKFVFDEKDNVKGEITRYNPKSGLELLILLDKVLP